MDGRDPITCTYEPTSGGATFAQVFAARGAKTSLDSSFQLLSPYLFAPRPAVALARLSPTQVSVTWSQATPCDRLQSATTLAGPWADVVGATNGQVIATSGTGKFFRIAHF